MRERHRATPWSAPTCNFYACILKVADRATFVVDPQGIIQAIEVTAEGIGRDASDLLRKLKQHST